MGTDKPKVEKLLNSGLKQYGETGPQPGLEERIFARLRNEQETPTSQSWRWQLALAAITVAAVASLPLVLKKTIATKPDQVATGTAETNELGLKPPFVVLPKPVDAAQRHVPRNKAQKQVASTSIPMLEQFPSPRPLSSQEELLLAYVRQTRSEEIVATINEKKNIGHLQIDTLEITPLAPDAPISKFVNSN